MKQVLKLVGSPLGLSGPIYYIPILTMIPGIYVASGISKSTPLSTLFLLVVFNVLFLWFLIFIAIQFLKRIARYKSRPVIFIITFQMVAIIRAITVDVALNQIGLVDESRLAQRILSNMFGLGIVLPLVTYFVALSKEYSGAFVQIEMAQRKAQEIESSTRERKREKLEELISSIRLEFSTRLESLVSNSTGVAVIRNLIDEVVRPESYRLFRGIEAENFTPDIVVPSKLPWLKLFPAMVNTQPFVPTMVTAWMTVTIFTFSLNQSGQALSVLVSFFAFLIPAVAIKRLWSWVPPQVMGAKRLILFISGSATIALFGMSLLSLTVGGPFAVPSTFLSGIFIAVIVVIGSGLVRAAMQEHRRIMVVLSEAQLELKTQIAKENVQFRHLQKSVSRALHGPVQDAASSAERKLASALNKGKPSPQLISELRQRLARSLDALDVLEPTRLDPLQRIRDLAELWEGSTDIDITVTQPAQRMMTEYRISGDVVAELVNEACSNAIRHGNALNINVDIYSDDLKALMLIVENDGSEISSSHEEGIGSQLFDELTSVWSRNSKHGQTVVKATIPII